MSPEAVILASVVFFLVSKESLPFLLILEALRNALSINSSDERTVGIVVFIPAMLSAL